MYVVYLVYGVVLSCLSLLAGTTQFTGQPVFVAAFAAADWFWFWSGIYAPQQAGAVP